MCTSTYMHQLKTLDIQAISLCSFLKPLFHQAPPVDKVLDCPICLVQIPLLTLTLNLAQFSCRLKTFLWLVVDSNGSQPLKNTDMNYGTYKMIFQNALCCTLQMLSINLDCEAQARLQFFTMMCCSWWVMLQKWHRGDLLPRQSKGIPLSQNMTRSN